MATIKQIQHQGYIAEVSYSHEDDCYYAQLVNAPGLNLLAEGDTIDALLKAFASIVEDYLQAVSNDGFGLVKPLELVVS